MAEYMLIARHFDGKSVWPEITECSFEDGAAKLYAFVDGLAPVHPAGRDYDDGVSFNVFARHRDGVMEHLCVDPEWLSFSNSELYELQLWEVGHYKECKRRYLEGVFGKVHQSRGGRTMYTNEQRLAILDEVKHTEGAQAAVAEKYGVTSAALSVWLKRLEVGDLWVDHLPYYLDLGVSYRRMEEVDGSGVEWGETVH